MTRQEIAIMAVVIIIVGFRQMWSPTHPKINAPIGLKARLEHKAKAVRRDAVWGSVLGKKSSLRSTAIWT